MEFALTPLLRSALERANLPEAGSAEESVILRRYLRTDASTILLTDVQALSQILRGAGTRGPASTHEVAASAPVWVHELLQGAVPILPSARKRPEPHPDLAPRLERLRDMVETREYAAMVGDIAVCGEDAAARDAAEMSTYRSQISVGVNLIVSMATMFCVGFYAGGTEAEPRGTRATMFGLFFMIVTLFIEMTLFLIGASRVDAQVHKRDQMAMKGVKDRTKFQTHQKADLQRGRVAKKQVCTADVPSGCARAKAD